MRPRQTPADFHGRHERRLEADLRQQAARLGIELVGRLDTAGAALERAASVQAVCEVAAEAFRKLTGFDRAERAAVTRALARSGGSRTTRQDTTGWRDSRAIP